MDISKLQDLMKKKKQDLTKREKTLKLQPGAQRFALLKGWRPGEEEVFFHAFGAHYIKDSSDTLQAVYPCAKATFGEPCAVCDGLNKAMKHVHDDDTVEVLKQAVAGERYLLNVLALDGEQPNTPQILEVPKTVFGAIVGLMEDWGEAIFDADGAQIVVIEKTGKGLSTRYTVQASPKKHKIPAAALAAIPNLDTYVKQESEEQMNRALTAINSVAGLLPSRDTPATTASTVRLGHTKTTAEDARVIDAGGDGPSLDDELDALLAGDGLDDMTGT